MTTLSDRPTVALADLAHGAEAARIFGVSRADSVWRMVERHGAEYPGRLEVIQIGNKKAMRREELAAFARWFAAGPGRNDKRLVGGAGYLVDDAVYPARLEAAERRHSEPDQATAAESEPARRAAVTDARRAKLARQIARLTGI